MTERVTALVTGVGGVYGLGCIENLRRSTLPIRIVGADMRWNAAGLFRSDATAILPSVETDGYLDALLSCCEEERVDVVFFSSGAEIRRVSRLRDQLDAGSGCLFVVNSDALVTLASDKLESMTALANLGLQVPQTRACASTDAIPSIVEELGFPVIAKPRFGQGSRGIFAFDSPADMDAGFTISEEYVLQERIGDEDHEYTVGVVGAEDGTVYGSIVLRRWLKDGLTVACEVVDEPEIANYAEIAARHFRPRGYFNVQLRLRDGAPCAFEINPRVSSSTPFRGLAGFNEPEMIIRTHLLGEVPDRPIPRKIAMVRGLAEWTADPETWRTLAPQ